MALENVGLTISAIGFILGVLLLSLGGFLYLIKNNNRMMIAKAARTIGIGILMIMVSIPFSIPNQLLAESTSYEIRSVIILSVFLGSPLIVMGMACYKGLNEKAHQILNPITAQEKLRYYSPMQKKKVL
jgi:uncharacterized sodium:solute symporter family permease YidK